MEEMYSIKDVKANLFSRPFFTRNAASAIRSVEMHVNSNHTDDPMVKYPEDFVLYQVGRWNDETGKVEPLDTPLSIAALSTLKREARS